MRPPGVRERMRELGVAERRLVESWTDRALRVRLTEFVDLTARLRFGDHGPGVVLRGFDSVAGLLDERHAISVEIAEELDAFRARVPWPVPE